MMEQREKLIELLYDIRRRKDLVDDDCIDDLADELLSNGVVVLPCRCGECEHWSRNVGVSQNSPTGHCWINQDEMLNSDFCSYAKRKDDIVDLCTTGHLHLGYVEEKGGDE